MGTRLHGGHLKACLYGGELRPAGEDTRQTQDPGCCIKVLFYRLTIYMGEAGNLPSRDLRKKSRDLS